MNSQVRKQPKHKPKNKQTNTNKAKRHSQTSWQIYTEVNSLLSQSATRSRQARFRACLPVRLASQAFPAIDFYRPPDLDTYIYIQIFFLSLGLRQSCANVHKPLPKHGTDSSWTKAWLILGVQTSRLAGRHWKINVRPSCGFHHCGLVRITENAWIKKHRKDGAREGLFIWARIGNRTLVPNGW